jgi:phosphohistidine phosphatase SixA
MRQALSFCAATATKRALGLACAFALQFQAAIGAEREPSVQAAWAALAMGGHTVIFRHSIDAPGNGDPDPRYRYGDCTYQRQLVPAGRAKAMRVGAEFNRRGIAIGDVMSSEWCRARDSADLMFGRHQTWNALNVMNPVTNPHMNTPLQLEQVTSRIAAWQGPKNLVFVTHLLNIQPLLNIYPAKGDAVVVRYDVVQRKLITVGQISFD